VYEETKGRAKDAVISLINQEREGKQIERALLNNVLGIYVKLGWDKWSTMKETLKLLCLLILLITMLEKHQIGLRKILVLITCSRPQAEDCLKKEIDRVDHYLHSRSRPKLIERYIPSVYFILLMQDLMLPVVISYVNAAIDTTAIGFKRSPGCIFTLTAIAEWECSSFGRALALHARGTGKVEGDGEVKVMTKGFGDLVAKLGDKVMMDVLVRCWSDGDVVVRSW
ncbi:reverse transcriptase domain-containing protein, partial [Tanacetum coccineum]